MKTLLLLALLCGGCGGVVLERLQEDLEALKVRMQAREEVKIHIAAAEPVTKNTSRADATEPHVTVAVPQCPPPGAGIVKYVTEKKKAAAHKRERRTRPHHKRG